MKTYRKLLANEPLLKRLSGIQLIVYFGAWFSNVAIYTLLLSMHVSAEIVAFTAMIHFASGIIQAPFSGSIIDKVQPKKLMLWLIFLEMSTTFFLVFITELADLWLLYILIFIKMAAASFYFTSEMSLLPKILSASNLQKANELHSIIWSLSYTLGMAVSGFVVYILGVKMAFILDGFILMAAFFLFYRIDIRVELEETQENLLVMMQDTFTYLKKYPHAMHLMFLHAFVGLTAFDALVALMVDAYYASIIATSLALGLLHASRAIGLVIGPVLMRDWVNNKRLVYIFIAQALAIWLWAYVMQNFYLSIVASVVVGFFTTTLWSYTYTLLQKNIDKKYYGRIVAYNDMLFLSIAAFTSYMIGYLATLTYSLGFITFLIGLGFAFGGIYYRWIYKTQKIGDVQ
ncbi:MAG TPA: MFS transporter [Sulfurimonas sp. UBA12504]|nr:MAG: MFS transporter [Sulfurimonas sp. GWF2_37_8]DAB30184.1 MAG TPA: MFS transporter [Sulfurimonas sp. UBA12504]